MSDPQVDTAADALARVEIYRVAASMIEDGWTRGRYLEGGRRCLVEALCAASRTDAGNPLPAMMATELHETLKHYRAYRFLSLIAAPGSDEYDVMMLWNDWFANSQLIVDTLHILADRLEYRMTTGKLSWLVRKLASLTAELDEANSEAGWLRAQWRAKPRKRGARRRYQQARQHVERLKQHRDDIWGELSRMEPADDRPRAQVVSFSVR